jgi:hypothetical protein
MNYYERYNRQYDLCKFKMYCDKDERTVTQIIELRTLGSDFILNGAEIDDI